MMILPFWIKLCATVYVNVAALRFCAANETPLLSFAQKEDWGLGKLKLCDVLFRFVERSCHRNWRTDAAQSYLFAQDGRV